MSNTAYAHMHTVPPREMLFDADATTAETNAPEPQWERAACRGVPTDPDLFFPEQGESAEPAKRICAGCPLRAECLVWSLADGVQFGVWGGLDEHERRTLRRVLAAADPSGPETRPAATPARGALREAIAAHLDAWPARAFTVSDLAKVLGRSRPAIVRALTALEAERRVWRVTSDPCRYASAAPRSRQRPARDREQMRAQICAHFAAHPDEEFTAAQVTRAIGANDGEWVRCQIERMQRAGDLKVDRSRGYPMYAAAVEFWVAAS